MKNGRTVLAKNCFGGNPKLWNLSVTKIRSSLRVYSLQKNFSKASTLISEINPMISKIEHCYVPLQWYFESEHVQHLQEFQRVIENQPKSKPPMYLTTLRLPPAYLKLIPVPPNLLNPLPTSENRWKSHQTSFSRNHAKLITVQSRTVYWTCLKNVGSRGSVLQLTMLSAPTL